MLQVQSGIANGFLGSHKGILDKGIQAPRLFAVHVLNRVEPRTSPAKLTCRSLVSKRVI